ncbi:Flp pilus assembly complex ATPase component TadA [Halorussus salilacus]|uniref:ATPase, T2SS/T4P/T4SS family n=1 Tax=Halorussus salilacus TaxID=2953750 RepID=UPI00209E8D59|nr:ATPase, T2SS/T4P/T4SS family [Halorussus salilacus]USZ68909.1 Flp pilus assembly complex ATPase component TadA [Halorussus salilacus]
MRDLLARLRETDDPACACEPTFESDRLVLDATDCPGSGDLAASPDCRATAVAALADRSADAVLTRTEGVERAYEGEAATVLVAAGRFAERVAFYDERLADRAERDPLDAARAAVGRAGPVGDIVAETGLAEVARDAGSDDDALRAFVGPPMARSRVAARPPPDAALAESRSLSSGATVRIYDGPDRALRTYHLEPVEATFDAAALETLARAHDLLAEGVVSGESDRAPGRAVRRVADSDQRVEDLAAVLGKHTRGYGVLADLFADPAVSDVFATAPVGSNPLRVTVDGERMRTNVRLTEAGAETLASRVRRASGRAFSRAAPTLAATAETGAGAVRVAGVTDPVCDGPGFAFRAREATPWTLPALVENGTVPADAAALLSLAVERAAAGLVAGARGAGKTTALGALLWELPAAVRTVVIEDTPELPVGPLQSRGRDVQPLRTATDDGTGLSPSDALRTALRLGEGALVVGEVRGEEAAVLYEAMRVGASGDAVLGTIHGDGGAAVRERVVSDLGVPASSFAVTDLVASLETTATPEGERRRVRAVEEVVDGDRFEPLFEVRDDALRPTGRIERGESRLVASLADPDERYADVRETLADRETLLDRLAREGRTDPADVTRAYAERDRRSA